MTENPVKKPKKQVREWQGWEPKEFTPSHCVDLIKCMAKGRGFQHFASMNNLSRATFYRWVQAYPDFSLAYQIGKIKADDYLIALLDEYKIEIGVEGTEKLNIAIWKELQKVTRTAVDQKESTMLTLSGSARTMMTSVLDALGQGLIELEEAERLAKLIETAQRITETSELMARIEELEQALTSGVKQDEFKEE